ncbi:MAG: hypothetical protein IJ154_04770 [Bacteroidales bacterium]|nr:hypothetical protein [Bacteroidales bacterium]
MKLKSFSTAPCAFDSIITMNECRKAKTILIVLCCLLLSACSKENLISSHADYEYPEIDVTLIENSTIFLNQTLLLEYLQACDEFDKHLLYDKGKAYYDGPKYYDNQLFMYLTQKLQESNERLERGEVLGRVFPRTKTGSESHPSGFTPVSQGTNDQQTGERLLSALVYIDAHHNDGLRFRDMIDISSFTHLLTSGYCTLGNGLWTWSVIRKDAAINNNNDELNSFETTSYSSGGGIIRVNYNFNSEPAITLHTENTAAFNAVISSNF